MREYETLYVQHPEVPEARYEEINARVRSLILEQGGEVISLEPWGMRELAYPIQKQKRGRYVLVRYRALPAGVTELERNLKLLDEVIRFITVRIPEHIRKRRQQLSTAGEEAATKEHRPDEGANA